MEESRNATGRVDGADGGVFVSQIDAVVCPSTAPPGQWLRGRLVVRLLRIIPVRFGPEKERPTTAFFVNYVWSRGDRDHFITQCVKTTEE
jgi:hypothetical protein